MLSSLELIKTTHSQISPPSGIFYARALTLKGETG
jgi:hypothetical protein